jgi:hypothetical protein
VNVGPLSFTQRAEALRRACPPRQRCQPAAAVFVRENGKPLAQARGELLSVPKRQQMALDCGAAFVDDQKRILVFIGASGTERGYHAELSARNHRLCVHYLLEPGWKADSAIQGFGSYQLHQSGPNATVPTDPDRCKKPRAHSQHHRAPSPHTRCQGPRTADRWQDWFRPENNLEVLVSRGIPKGTRM